MYTPVVLFVLLFTAKVIKRILKRIANFVGGRDRRGGGKDIYWLIRSK
jgi:hypothetical protein